MDVAERNAIHAELRARHYEMRQQAKRFEWEIRQRVQIEIAEWRAMMLPEYNGEAGGSQPQWSHGAQGLHGRAGAVQQVRFVAHEDTYQSRSAKTVPS